MHLDKMNVKVGDKVTENQSLGTVGGSGKGKTDGQAVHLHYEIHKMGSDGKFAPVEPAPNGQMLDPQRWLAGTGKTEPVAETSATSANSTAAPTAATQVYGLPDTTTAPMQATVKQWLAGQH